MENWRGKVALVTGASSGIGASLVMSFAKAGIITVGLARRVELIEALKEQLDPMSAKNLHSFKGDVRDEKSVENVFQWIADKFGGVNILVNNAGVLKGKMLLDVTDTDNESINEVVGINLLGLVYCTRAAYKQLKQNDAEGYIININSILGHNIPIVNNTPAFSFYPATKYAVTATTEIIRQELIFFENKKVRVTSISPGTVDTEIFDGLGMRQHFLGGTKTDMTKLDPDDITQAILYVLGTPAHVQIKEIIIKPTGEVP